MSSEILNKILWIKILKTISESNHKLSPMLNHGHFLSFASLPLPLPLSEKLNIERVGINK